MMEAMIPSQVGMSLRTLQKKEAKEAHKKKAKEAHQKNKKMREKETRGNSTILYHTCVSE